MNKKASLEWNLETVGKLVLYAVILLIIAYFLILLSGAFVADDTSTTAQRNFEIIADRIEYMMKEKVYSDNVIVQLPNNYVIIGFDVDAKSQKFAVSKVKKREYCYYTFIPLCDECLCLYDLRAPMKECEDINIDDRSVVICKKFEDIVDEKVYFKNEDFNPAGTNTQHPEPLFYTPYEAPRSMKITQLIGTISVRDVTAPREKTEQQKK